MGTPVVIAGMHRSGTSLLANLLQEAGIVIGEKLLAAAVSNPKGHFEDVAFMELQQKALGGEGAELLYTASADEHIPVSPGLADEARKLIDARSELPVWGFKDPRTTLFLDFWASLLPEARFVLIYRSPEFVLNSLRRRRDPPLITVDAAGREKFEWRRAADMWCAYNRRLLNFLATHPQQCVLLRTESLAADFPQLLQFLGEQWQLPLRKFDPFEVLEPSLMRSQIPPVLRWKIRLRRSVRATLRDLDAAYRDGRPW